MSRLLGAILLLAAQTAWAQTTIVYSRADASTAQRAYRLAAVYDTVAMDSALRPGIPWRPAMLLAICHSQRVLLLWSRRAAASVEVAREIQAAALCGVPVVPVLLDSTRLPDDVGQLQAVDWR